MVSIGLGSSCQKKQKLAFYLYGKYHLFHVQDFGYIWEAIRWSAPPPYIIYE